ncbi:MAG TPA: hypothetical protein VEV82_08915 [Actinomycetota bacterium]|nr:hypothetical protein [Actinomycetota bacterium]
MIVIEGAASLLSRVLILPKLADDLLTAASQQNAREALADGRFRRRFYAITRTRTVEQSIEVSRAVRK